MGTNYTKSTPRLIMLRVSGYEQTGPYKYALIAGNGESIFQRLTQAMQRPDLGQHTAQTLTNLGIDAATQQKPHEAGIIDLGNY